MLIDLSSQAGAGPLVVDVTGRLLMGDKVLPVVPAGVRRGGTVPVQFPAPGDPRGEIAVMGDAPPTADAAWYEPLVLRVR